MLKDTLVADNYVTRHRTPYFIHFQWLRREKSGEMTFLPLPLSSSSLLSLFLFPVSGRRGSRFSPAKSTVHPRWKGCSLFLAWVRLLSRKDGAGARGKRAQPAGQARGRRGEHAAERLRVASAESDTVSMRWAPRPARRVTRRACGGRGGQRGEASSRLARRPKIRESARA